MRPHQPHARRVRRPARRLSLGAVEPLESRRLLSVAPGQPDLVPASDTGASATDNLTSFDNTASARRLSFLVPGTTPGATVVVYVDGVAAGSSVAAGPEALVPLNVGTRVLEGVRSVTARQQEPGQPESPDSPALAVTVDLTRPHAALVGPPNAPPPPPRLGDPAYTFDVAYTDARGIDAATLDKDDVRVTGPGGAVLPAELVAVLPDPADPRRVVGRYRIPAPGGAWDADDNGFYTLSSQTGQVRDNAGNVLFGSTLGQFRVNFIGRPATPDLHPSSDSGVSDTDNVTNHDNATPERSLRFDVGRTYPGATVTLYADGTAIASVVAGATTTTLVTDGARALAPGVHRFTVRQTIAGQPDPPESPALEVTIDTSAPPRPAPLDLRAESDTGVSDADNITNTPAPAFDVTLESAPYFRVYRDGRPFSEPFAPAAGPVTVYTAALPDGTHRLTVAAVDVAGNVSEPSEPLVVTMDTGAPPAGWRGGELDPTLDGDGLWVLPRRDRGIAVQPDGRLVMGSYRGDGFSGPQYVARYNPDGSPDTAFGNGGEVDLPVSGNGPVHVLPDGSILVFSSYRLVRVSSGGVVDRSFGEDGVAALDFSSGPVAQAPGGKILVAGMVNSGAGDRMAVTRLNPDGSRDTTFGAGGQAVVPVGPLGAGFPTSIAAAPDGKVLLSGFAYVPGSQELAVLARLNPDGSPDTTFAERGVATVRTFFNSLGFDVALLPDGKVLLAGTGSTNTQTDRNTHGFVARYNPDGTPDASFGNRGVASVRGHSIGQVFLAAVEGGDVLLGGTHEHFDSNAGDVMVTRLGPDGTPRRDFGEGGTAYASFQSPGYGGQVGGMATAGADQLVLWGARHGFPDVAGPVMFRLRARTVGAPDLTAASDAGVSDRDDLTNDSTPTFDLSVRPPDGAAPTAFYRLYRDGQRVGGNYEAAGQFTAPQQPDGAWDYAASWVDAAGNESQRGPALHVTIETVPPRVDAASLSSANWPAEVVAAVAESGGAAFDMSDPRPPTLPWLHLDRVTLRFSELIPTRADALIVTGAGGARYPATALSTNAAARSATWTLAAALPADKVLLTLSHPAADAAGNVAAAPVPLRFNVLPGDADRNGVVNTRDYVQVRSRLGARVAAPPGAAPYSPFCDFNGDGVINALDLATARARLGSRLPPGDPGPVPGPGPAQSVRAPVPLFADDRDDDNATAAILG